MVQNCTWVNKGVGEWKGVCACEHLTNPVSVAIKTFPTLSSNIYSHAPILIRYSECVEQSL